MATTVSTVTVVVDAPVLVDTGTIRREMAARTIRLVQRRRPLDDLGIGLVALGTIEVAAVVQRLIGQPRMHVDMRNPVIRRMALIAFAVGDEVPVVLASCDISVMAGQARTEYFVMIDRCYRRPDCRCVAALADVGCAGMSWMLACRIGAVVAADAIAGDSRVIEVGG